MGKRSAQEYTKEVRCEVTESSTWDPSTVSTGALLRIAEATELMAQDYRGLKERIGRLEKIKCAQSRCIVAHQRSIAALRGHITRLKRKFGEV